MGEQGEGRPNGGRKVFTISSKDCSPGVSYRCDDICKTGRAGSEPKFELTSHVTPTQMTVVQPDAAAGAEVPPPETIEELFAALESPLLSYALRLVGERAPAEDVVQEAFMKLHGQFAEVKEPRRWLYRTVHNLALNQRRQAAKTVPMETGTGADGEEQADNNHNGTDPEPLPDEQIIRWEGIGLVRLSLSTLDERSREVVRLKFDENLSYQEIARRTGLSASNVGYLLHHALKAIAAELARTGLIP